MTMMHIHGMHMQVFLFLGSVAIAILITGSVLMSMQGREGGSTLDAKNKNTLLLLTPAHGQHLDQGIRSSSSHHSRRRATASKDASEDKNPMQGGSLDMLFAYASAPRPRRSSLAQHQPVGTQ
jgi:hypothetical protein